MSKPTAPRKRSVAAATQPQSETKIRLRGPWWRWPLRFFGGVVLIWLAFVLAYRVVNPPVTAHMYSQWCLYGPLERQWVPLDEMTPALARSIVAAEDANFCQHFGFDMAAIRQAVQEGGSRGASTLSQQTVKNVFLWQARSWPRKALEAIMTPVVELLWPKRRIIEVYLNVAEFGAGVFGAEAAAQHYFDRSAAELSDMQAARLAAILPDPKRRDAAPPSDFVQRRAASILDGAQTILLDGRAACFED